MGDFIETDKSQQVHAYRLCLFGKVSIKYEKNDVNYFDNKSWDLMRAK